MQLLLTGFCQLKISDSRSYVISSPNNTIFLILASFTIKTKFHA